MEFLDISTWNKLNKQDYDAIAKGYDGVIMRIGYTGWGKPAKQKVVDDLYEQHDRELRKRNVPLGIYWYGTDESKQEAELAAKICLKLAKDRDYPLGVFYDTEDNYYQRAMNKDKLTETVLGFTNYIKKHSNFQVGVYASTYWFKDQLHFNQLKDLIIWEANYGTNNGKVNSKPHYKPHIHQFTSNHMINNKRFDNNEVLIKYWDVKAPNPVDKKTVDELIKEVYNREHGDDEERRKSLGDRFEEVQAEINRRIEAEKVNTSEDFEVNNEVYVTGRLYRDSLGNGAGMRINNHKGTIDRYVKGAKKPYHIAAKGWVDKSNLSKASKPAIKKLKVGDKVWIDPKATNYATGTRIPKKYKNKWYTVQQLRPAVNPKEVLIKELYSWVWIKDIRR